jgi:hypothetical protein
MTTYDLFTGFIESVPATWSGVPVMGDDNVQIGAVDAMKVFNLARVTTTRGVEPVGTRIEALLDEIGWTERAIDVTETDVQAVTLTNAGVLSHFQEASQSEGGVGFIAADGTATFYDKHHVITLDETNDTYGENDKRYARITTTYDESNLWSEVVVTAEGLTDQTASTPAEYPRTLQVSTLLTTEADMLERAESLLAKYYVPEFRISTISFDNASLDDAIWPRLLVHDLHERVLVRTRLGGEDIEQPSFIEGITWQIDPGRWQVTWNLSSTLPQVGQWELGTVGLSELGETTTLVNTIA